MASSEPPEPGMASSELPEHQVVVSPQALHQFCTRCMLQTGARPHHAEVWAELIVAADVRGHYSHGLNRLDYYLNDVVAKNVRVDTEPEIVKQTAATALVNGNDLLGPAVGKFCMDLAIEKAKDVGIGWVSAHGSNHFGIAGWYAMRAMDHGLLGMAFCNSSPNMIPPRGKARTLGTNPISVAARGENGDCFVLDMATTAVSQGKVEIKDRLGQSLPSGWGLDENGKLSTDPQEVLLKGGLCPLGGTEESGSYKGFGLGMMVEIFCSILSGSLFGTGVRAWSPDGFNTKANLGQCFVAIDPSAFAPGFEGRLSELIQQCKDCEKVEGETEILTPGDPEKVHTELCDRLGGIPYHAKQIAFADFVAEKYGIEPVARTKLDSSMK